MNNMDFSQASTLLNAIVSQATGETPLTAITTPQDLVSVAQTVLKTGYDTVFNAVSQVWSDTIFSGRPYKSPYNDMEITLSEYGNAIRKITPIAAKMIDDMQFTWPVSYDAFGHSENSLGNGESVDMYKINKQEVLQTNFYGTAVYEQDYTIFRNQLKQAFENYNEFTNFNMLNMLQRANDREVYKENIARCMQLNFIASIIDENKTERVVHLLTEYNALTGLTLTDENVYAPENFAPFIRWVYAKINTICGLMSSQSVYFQTLINGKNTMHHSPRRYLRIAIISEVLNQIKSMVNPVNYNNSTFSIGNFTEISYWQSIEKPYDINITPVYTHTDGSVKTGDSVTNKKIIGIIHDKDALAYAEVDPWTARTPLNIKGGYWNESYHAKYKTIQDMTEKACVLLLD